MPLWPTDGLPPDTTIAPISPHQWLTAGGSAAAIAAQNARYGLTDSRPSNTAPPAANGGAGGHDRDSYRHFASARPSSDHGSLRIAVVAPLAESVPPAKYGGTERVVSVLTEELVRRGHEVTLFASGDSRTSARLVPCSAVGLRLDPSVTDYLAYAMTELGQVHRLAGEFDLVHNHLDYVAFPTARLSPTPTVTTCHGRLDLPEVQRVYDDFREQPLVAISADQRTYLPRARWVETVHNAVDIALFQFKPDPGDYLVFLGRISPEKRPDRAIEVARNVGIRLVIAAKVDAVDRDYYEHAIAPVIRQNPDLVEFVGEVDERGKNELLGGALAYLFPIDWPEPFGLTMAEAMATGTPVVACRAGSVSEVVQHGVTGFVCETAGDLAAAVQRAGDIDRAACRERVERLFSPGVMADGYERTYARVIADHRDRAQFGAVVRPRRDPGRLAAAPALAQPFPTLASSLPAPGGDRASLSLSATWADDND